MDIAVMSYAVPSVVEAVRRLGFETLEVRPFPNSAECPEALHADMQLLALPEGDVFLVRNNTTFNEAVILKIGSERIRFTASDISVFRYPDCVLLNTFILGKLAVANLKYCDKNAAERLKALGYRLVHVNQGYARCSTAIVCDEAAITSDKAIAAALRENGKDVLEILSGHIDLCESYGGFIGGASFLHGGVLYFVGDIAAHPDFLRIEAFCKKYGVKVSSLSPDPLFDIGGVVIITRKH